MTKTKFKWMSLGSALVVLLGGIFYLTSLSAKSLDVSDLSSEKLSCPGNLKTIARDDPDELKRNARPLEMPKVAEATACAYVKGLDETKIVGAKYLDYSFSLSEARILLATGSVEPEGLKDLNSKLTLKGEPSKCSTPPKEEVLYLLRFETGEVMGLQVAEGDCSLAALTEDPFTAPAGESSVVPTGLWGWGK